jgi:hypothetical protein
MPTKQTESSQASFCCKAMTAAMALVPVAGSSLRGAKKDSSKKYDLLNPDSKSDGSKFTNDQLYDTPFSLNEPQALGIPHKRRQVTAMRDQEESLLKAMKEKFKDVDFSTSFRLLSHIDEETGDVIPVEETPSEGFSFVSPCCLNLV